MDSLTHVLVGNAMGAVAAASAQPHGSAAYWAVLIGNSLPDIDVPISLLIAGNINHHRTITHTLPGTTVLAAITAAVMTHFLPGTPVALLFAWVMLGSLMHLGLDCLNLFGANPFWPLTDQPIQLGVLHIVDPVILVLLGLPSVAVLLHWAAPVLLQAGFYLMLLYVAYRIAVATRLYRRLQSGPESIRVRIVPWWGTWRYVMETNHAIEFGAWRSGSRFAMQVYPKQDGPLVQASLANPEVSQFLALAEYPYAVIQEEDGDHEVVWGDALRQLRADFRPLRIRVER
ncbi:MAG: metal-dependent hydrolase [Mycobacterium leprae]